MAFKDPFATGMQSTTQAVEYDAGLRSYMLRIYNYMTSGLVLTGITALFTANSPVMLNAIYRFNEGQAVSYSPLGWIIMLAPLVFIFGLGAGINRLSLPAAQGLFWAFSVVMGLSLSSIFLAYTGESIARTFFVTAGAFGGMSIYGYTTKKDLSGWRSFLMMGLIGLILASIAQIFIGGPGLYFAISVIGVLIFTGLTAYDTQRLKALYYQIGMSAEAAGKVAILGALSLYLDFINMFMYLLRFMGDRR